MNSYISLKDVTKKYHVGELVIPALAGIDLEVERGEFAVVLGPSGSGKTTLLNIVGGIDFCDSGHILVDGADITQYGLRELTEYRRADIGFVFQFYNLLANLTALENVELSIQMRSGAIGSLYQGGEEEGRNILTRVGLEERLDNFPSQLSGGEQQRVAIARALAKRPKLLLCDEPTGALDYVTGKSILALLQETCRNLGMTVMLITHNSAIAPMADKVIRIKSGLVEEIVKNATPKHVEDIEW